MKDSPFLKNLLGADCSTALMDVAKKVPGLEAAVGPRAIVSWLTALGGQFDGKIPGSEDILKFDRVGGLYTGLAKFSDQVVEYRQIPTLELAAILSVGMGEDVTDSSAKPKDLARLGKSLDKMVFAIMDSSKRSIVKDYLAKADAIPVIKVKLPHRIKKAEPKGTTAKPTDATAPAQQTPSAPKKQTTSQRPQPGSIPGLNSKTIKVEKHEASQTCKVCGKGRFSNNRFVGCVCYSELAKSVTTKVIPDGYLLKTSVSSDFESLMSLAGSYRGRNG